MTNSINSIISKNGPILSADLLAAIRADSSGELSDDAMRKRLSRLSPEIKRIKGFFAQQQSLYYNDAIFGTPEFYDGLRNALNKAGKQYAYLLNALEFHYGSLPIQQLSCYGVNPRINTIGHLTFSTAIDRLKNLYLVNQNDETISLSRSILGASPNDRHTRALLLVKDVLLLQFSDWARKIGLTSFHTAKFYVDFNNYGFAFVSPSYVAPLTSFRNNKLLPGFVVADILIGNRVRTESVEFFIKKIDILRAKRGLVPLMPILIVDNLEPDALKSLKSKGILIGFINQLFGPEYQELMEALIREITNAGAILKKNPESFIKLLQQLTALVGGKTNNLKGDLFEMAVGYYHSKMGCGTLDIGKDIYHGTFRREIDVFAVYGNKIIIAECKAQNYAIDKQQLEEWVSEKIPVIREWILSSPSIADKQIVFQYWATGGFDESAQQLIEVIQPKTKKHLLEFFDQGQMLEKSKEAHSKRFTELLHEYFIKDDATAEKISIIPNKKPRSKRNVLTDLSGDDLEDVLPF